VKPSGILVKSSSGGTAAKDLDFITAAQYRDEMLALKKILKGRVILDIFSGANVVAGHAL